MKSIVILGAGFGGIQVAKKLSKKIKKYKLTDSYQVILVDQNAYHTYTPTLYEIATTSGTVADENELQKIVAFQLSELFKKLPVRVVTAKVNSIDKNLQEIRLEKDTRIHFDYLVLALGAQINYFGIPGLATHSLPLKTFADAINIRERILELADEREKENVKIVIGGGGPTGTELAAEIKMLFSTSKRLENGACKGIVTIIDGAPTILSQFKKSIIKTAEKRLAKVGVDIIAGERISSVEATQVILLSGKMVPYDLLIWTGGVSPNSIMSTLDMKKDQSGQRVITNEEMLCLSESANLASAEKIYGIGDAICFIDPKTNKPTPGVARSAIIQANVVAFNIEQKILADENKIKTVKPRHYKPMKYPYILPVGGKFAIAEFGPIVYSGVFAWITKGLVELNYLLSIFTPLRALKYWLKGLWIFLRSNKL